MIRRICDVPPNERGIPYDEWLEGEFRKMAAEAARLRTGEPWINRLPIATPRDRYGMKGVIAGTRALRSNQ